LDDARHKEAAEYFTAAISVLSSERTIHSKYEIFVVVRSYGSTENVFHAQLRALCSSSGGTFSPCGKVPTRNGAMHSSWRVDFLKRTKRIDT
jgi:hypothetical protein